MSRRASSGVTIGVLPLLLDKFGPWTKAAGRVGGEDLAGHQPVEEMAERGELLLDRLRLKGAGLELDRSGWTGIRPCQVKSSAGRVSKDKKQKMTRRLRPYSGAALKWSVLRPMTTESDRRKDYPFAKRTVEGSVGESVRIISELQELSQNQLADLTGIPQSTISAIENDRVRLGVERAKILARALKCYPAVLVFPGWEVGRESAA